MALTLDDAHALFRAGHYAEILARQSAHAEALAILTQEHRVLIAHTLVQTGHTGLALAIVRTENAASTPPLLRSRCEVILGLARRRDAAPTEALKHFQAAVQLARESRDHRQLGWAYVQLFRVFAELHPAEHAPAMLRDVRLHVMRAGDPHVTAYMHDGLALMEASAGRVEAARRHLKTSMSILDRYPNAWLRQVGLISAFCLDFLECRYEDAMRNIAQARRLLPIVGEQHRAIIDCNEGHALLKTGQFREASERLRQVLRDGSVFHRLGALDGLARIALASGQLDECESTLADIERSCTQDAALPAALGVRWGAVTRLKYLLKRQRWNQAAREADLYLRNAVALDDRFLCTSIACLKAEALAADGRLAEARTCFMSIDVPETRLPRELHAQYYLASSALLNNGVHPVASTMLARAQAVWHDHGDRCAPLEASHSLASRVTADVPPNAPDATTILTPAEIVSAIGAAFELSYSRRLLGRELLAVISGLQCSPDARLVESRPASADLQSDDRRSTLTLGEHLGKKLTLVCQRPDAMQKALMLTDVLRIGRAALTVQRHCEEERNRAALWSPDPVEEQDGPLFLAPQMQTLLATARRIAPIGVPVLLTGETGTGKEVLARMIHGYSNRARAAFLPFNCTSTPKEMLDSQLFGHRRGAFTGATEHFKGVVRAAAGGTLFLDEIGEIGLDLQPKLLRFLESGEVHPIGDTQPVRIDVRVMAATNADLDGLVAQGRFREDLFYRLDIVRLHLPPLRERRVEIPALATHYLQKHAQEWHKGDLRLAEETMEYLVLYRWPGNVRQLANEMRRLAALAEPDAVLMPGHLAPDIAASRRTVAPSERRLDSTEVAVRMDQPMAAAVEHLERTMVHRAMTTCGGRVEEAAAMLGLSRKGLYLKRQRFGLIPGEASMSEPA